MRNSQKQSSLDNICSWECNFSDIVVKTNCTFLKIDKWWNFVFFLHYAELRKCKAWYKHLAKSIECLSVSLTLTVQTHAHPKSVFVIHVKYQEKQEEGSSLCKHCGATWFAAWTNSHFVDCFPLIIYAKDLFCRMAGRVLVSFLFRFYTRVSFASIFIHTKLTPHLLLCSA